MRASNLIQLFALTAAVVCTSEAKNLSSFSQKERKTAVGMLTNHVIRSDRDGLALQTYTDKEVRFDQTNDFKRYVDNILDRAELWSRTNQPVSGNTKQVVRILIHIHGGLNQWDDTVDRMKLVPKIMTESNYSNRYYPIFISWPSSYKTSYSEHLTRLRQGNRSPLFAKLSMPVLLATDAAEAAVGMPLAWGYQLINIKNRLLYSQEEKHPGSFWARRVSRNYKMAVTNSLRPEIQTNYHVMVGEMARSVDDLILRRYFVGVVTTPLRASIGTWAEGAMTADAWQVMKRRTGNLFYPPDKFEMGRNDQPDYLQLSRNPPAGEFFRYLTARIQTHTNLQYRITFVGHSMGTIVLNRLFVAYREQWLDSQAIENIVYMGAACSVWEALQAIPPLLTDKRSDNLKFYNLTLHPLAEMSEEMSSLVLPSGSLLYLIDTHLESPLGPLDRTLGSQVNLMSGIEAFEDVKVREKCYFKGFDFISGRIPEAHGDFSECPFWRCDFRELRKPNLISAAKNKSLVMGKKARTPSGERWTSTYPANWMEEERLNPAH